MQCIVWRWSSAGLFVEKVRRMAWMAQVKVPEECPQVIADLIQQCLSGDPDKRPTASELVRILSNPTLGRKPIDPQKML